MTADNEFYVKIGNSAVFSKTISEADIYLYTGLTGDFSPNHINEAEMRKTAYGRRTSRPPAAPRPCSPPARRNRCSRRR